MVNFGHYHLKIKTKNEGNMTQKLLTKLKRPITGLTALLLGLATAAPLVLSGAASAGGQAQSRFIQLSNSNPSATGVTYNVSFKPTSTSTVGGMIVDFCADSPISGSTSCTFPTGFTLGTSVSVSGMSGFTVNTGWVTTSSLQCGAAASNFQVAVLTNSTPATPTGTSTPINFQITGVTNTSTTGTFYARIYTFDTSAHTTSNYTCPTGTTRGGSMVGELDYGGVALSTATLINITATVQEQLTFCTSKGAPGNGCTSLTSPNLTLGSGSPAILGTAVSTDTAYTQLTTNAQSGVVVNMKAFKSDGLTAAGCNGMSRDNFATCDITGIGAFANLAASSGNFGLNVADGTGGTGSVTHNANYGTTAGSYGMQAAVASGAYGDPIESSSGAVQNVNSQLTFAAAAAPTTPAGVYSAYESLIATGTF